MDRHFATARRAALACVFAFLSCEAAVAGDLGDQLGSALGGWSVYGGFSAHNAGLFTSGDVNGVDINLEARAPVIDVLQRFGAPRPILGANIATHTDDVSSLYGGLSFTLLQYQQVSLEGQVGGAVHNGSLDGSSSRRALGCRMLFHLGVDVDWRFSEHWSAQAYADHMSNANLCDHNAGVETAGLRLGYHF